jgi:excisionase family DNA binding protein
VIKDEDKLLTVKEVSKILRVDETTCRRWIKDGTLEAITLPRKGNRHVYRIKQSTLNEILKEINT